MLRFIALPLALVAVTAFAAGCHSPRLPDRPKWEPYSYEPPPVPDVLPSAPAAPASPDDAALAARFSLDMIARDLSVAPLFPWRHIVLHHSATPDGNAAKFDLLHKQKGWDGLGYHFVIGNGKGSGDGQIEVGWRWKAQREGAHAGSVEYNRYGIGICFVGDCDRGSPTAKQVESCVRLVKYLMARCRIPPNQILRHGEVRQTLCPGRHFPFAEIVRRCTAP